MDEKRSLIVSKTVWLVFEPLWNIRKSEGKGLSHTSYADGLGEIVELLIHLWRRTRMKYSKEEYMKLKSFLHGASRITTQEVNGFVEIVRDM